MLGMSFCAGNFCFLRINKFIFVCLIIIIHSINEHFAHFITKFLAFTLFISKSL